MNFLTLVVLTKNIWVSTFHGFHYYKLEIDLSGLTNFHVRSLLFLQFFDKGQFDVFSLKSSLFDWNWKFVSDNSESAVWFVRQDRDGMYVFIFKTSFSIWTQSELCHLRVKVLSWLCSEFESQFKIKTKQRKMEKNQKDVDSTYSLFWNPDSCFVHAWSKAKWLQDSRSDSSGKTVKVAWHNANVARIPTLIYQYLRNGAKNLLDSRYSLSLFII